MARRRTRDELRNEFAQVLDIWTHVRTFQVSQMQGIKGIDPDQDLPTSSALLDKFDNGPGTASEHLSGLRQALNQWLVGLPDALKHNEATAIAFVEHYKQSAGRDFFDDMGDPSRRLKVILNKKRLQDEDEYYLLKQVLDEDLSVLTASEKTQASELMSDFELGKTQ